MAALSPMPVGKQVFLLVIGPITTVMHGMTPAAVTVKKAAFGRSKSPADAGKKKRPHSGHPRVDRSVLTSPIPDSCKGKWFIQITLDTARRSSSHLELAGEDFCLNSRHLRRAGRGFWLAGRSLSFAPQAAATLNRKSPARHSASRKGNGVAIT